MNILLVEDAVDLAKVITRELQAAGYQAHHSADGLTALELHARYQPDLVILDWMLPGLVQYNLEQGLSPWSQLLLGSLGGLVVTVLGAWDVIRRDVL